MEAIARVFTFLRQSGFETNDTCGLHINLSNGDWNAFFCSDPAFERFKNVWRAFRTNEPFFLELIAPHRRYTNQNCLPYPASLTDRDIASFESSDAMNRLLFNGEFETRRFNPEKLYEHGTFEERGHEAESYWKAHTLGYIQMVVLFGYEASLNPHVRAEEVIEKYSLDYRRPRDFQKQPVAALVPAP
jgi:hypothetical protein